MRNNQGFTLIEIMVVIVIVGITFGFALIAFGDFGESKRVLFAAEQVNHTLHLAQQQAILDTSTLGLHIDNNGYQILELQASGRWAPVSDKGIFKMHYFPKDTLINLKTENQSAVGTPPIIINSSGDMTAFTLRFSTKKESSIALITGSRNGDLQLQQTGDTQ